MDECINLKERFGKRWKVRYEESYKAERGERAFAPDPWLLVIACQHGEIYPHGGNMLGVSTNRRGQISKRISELPFTKITQDGDDGINAVFHIDNIEKVAAIMKPRRRKRLSPEHRAKLVAAGTAALVRHRLANSGIPPRDHAAPQTTQPVSEVA